MLGPEREDESWAGREYAIRARQKTEVSSRNGARRGLAIGMVFSLAAFPPGIIGTRMKKSLILTSGASVVIA
jgi:hypothetical protein